MANKKVFKDGNKIKMARFPTHLSERLTAEAERLMTTPSHIIRLCVSFAFETIFSGKDLYTKNEDGSFTKVNFLF